MTFLLCVLECATWWKRALTSQCADVRKGRKCFNLRRQCLLPTLINLPLVPAQPTYLEEIFSILGKTFHGFSKKLRRFQFQTLFCLLDLVEMFISFLSQQVLTLKLLFLNHNLRELDFVCLCVSDKLAKLGDAIAISNHSLTHWLTGVCAGRFYRIEKSWSPHLPCIQGVFFHWASPKKN